MTRTTVSDGGLISHSHPSGQRRTRVVPSYRHVNAHDSFGTISTDPPIKLAAAEGDGQTGLRVGVGVAVAVGVGVGPGVGGRTVGHSVPAPAAIRPFEAVGDAAGVPLPALAMKKAAPIRQARPTARTGVQALDHLARPSSGGRGGLPASTGSACENRAGAACSLPADAARDVP
jgi:hypothetical protein